MSSFCHFFAHSTVLNLKPARDSVPTHNKEQIQHTVHFSTFFLIELPAKYRIKQNTIEKEET